MAKHLRVNFTDGTSAIDGTIGGGAPTVLDEEMALDVARGWDLGEGTVLPDGRVVSFCGVEDADEAVTGVRATVAEVAKARVG
jgi:hypothetical protein